MNVPLSSRMNPARQTRSTPCRFSSDQQPGIVNLAVQTFGRKQDGREAAAPRRFETGRIRAVADHDGDLGLQFTARDTIGDGFEIGPAPGDENAQAGHRYSTRGAPRLRATTSPMRNGFSLNLRKPASARGTIRARHHQNHADTQVESAPEILFRYVARCAAAIRTAAAPSRRKCR